MINDQSVDNFLMANSKYFEAHMIPMIREELKNMSEEQFRAVQFVEYKDPLILLVISIVIGYLGIDRMLLGQIGLGILKLVTCGGLGIWSVIDWFLIMKETKTHNLTLFQKASYLGNIPIYRG